MKYIAVLIILSSVLTACGPGKRMARNPKGEQVTLEPIVVSAKDNKLDIYRASAPVLWDITHTSVALSFNWQEKTADGIAWIDIHPHFYATDSLVLDAKGMRIDTVALASKNSLKDLRHIYRGDSLIIHFDKLYDAGETVQLYIRYKAMPYGQVSGGSAAITDDRGLYFINTDGAIPNKPRQIWTQGETESNSHWLPTIDKPNERFTVKVELTVPDTMQTLGNGSKTGEKKLGNGMRIDTWEIDKPIQAYAIMFAIGKFAIVKDKWRDKDVNYYVEHEYEPYASKMFNNTPEMMEFFSKITGVPYPWKKYDQIVVRDYVSGAMENTTASLYGEFMNQNFREIADKNYEDIVSHELFHQWFGDYVTMESWSNLTVSESFANYGEQLWRRYKYGAESADKLAYEDLQKYLVNRTTDPPLVRFYYADKESMFDRISYEKGGAILHYMHGLMGSDAFYKAMNVYLTKNALSSVEATHWRHAVEEVTGKDWNWFFDQFYYHSGHPNLDIKYDYSDKNQELYLTITQNSSDSGYYYQLPLKAAIIYNADKTVIDWTVSKRKEVFTYPYKNGVRPVIIPDVMHWLPGTIKDNKNTDQWLIQYTNADDYISKRLAIAAAVRSIEDSSAQVLIDKALNDKNGLVRSITLDMIVKLTQEKWAKRWSPQVALLAVSDPYNDVRSNAFDMLGTWKTTTSKQDMVNALNDSSYFVAGSALYALYKIDSALAYTHARQILETDPKSSLEISAQSIVAERGDVSDITYFEAKAPYVYGSRKLAFTSILATYLTEVKDIDVFERGLKIIAQLAKNESIKSYRYYIGYYAFELAKTYKKGNGDEKARYEKAKMYAEEIVKSETDPGNLTEYKNLRKSAFAEENN